MEKIIAILQSSDNDIEIYLNGIISCTKNDFREKVAFLLDDKTFDPSSLTFKLNSTQLIHETSSDDDICFYHLTLIPVS